MKRLLWTMMVLAAAVGTSTVHAQNKNLAVGTATPNNNAALHVESPTNNQGIIIPRLTTAQRTSFTGALGAGDVGLIVFDTNLRALAIWNGTAWDVGMKTGEPITATNASGTGHAGLFENTNAANANPTLLVNKVGPGNAITANAPVQATAFVGDGSRLSNIAADSINGLGPLSLINNVGSVNISDNTITNDDVFSGAAIAGTKINPNFGAQNIATTGTVTATSFSGDGSALTGISGFTVPYTTTQDVSAPMINLTNTSTLFGAAQFGAAGSGGYAVEAVSTGVGALRAQSTGGGAAGVFSSNANTPGVSVLNTGGQAFSATNAGLNGPVATFEMADPTSSTVAVLINNAGSGNAITANRPIQATSFIGDGSALTGVVAVPGANSVATAQITDATITDADINGAAAIAGAKINPNFGAQEIRTTGRSSSGKLVARTTGADTVLYAEVNNPANVFPAVLGVSNSEGGAGVFILNSATSGAAGLYVETQANGQALDVLTSGPNSAGRFIVNNGSNASPILQGTTVGTGSGIELNLNTASANPGILINKAGGTGNAITANRPIQATAFIGDGSALTGVSGSLSLPFVGSSPTAGNTFDVTSTAASGSVARFVTNNAANAGDVVAATTNGTGNVLDVSNTNAASVAAVLNISHAGNANGILSNREINVNNTSTNTGGGSFTVANSGNSNPALFSTTNGGGFALSAVATGTGPGGNIQIGNSGNVQNALNVQTNGTGRGINMILSNGGNTNPAINILHSGTGNAITANRPIQATGFIGDGSQLTSIIPSGIIMPFAGTTAPAGYLLCNGAAVSRTTYAALFAAIGTNWGVGDGSTTFNLPDLRGRFMRGVDGGAGNDPDAATRTAFNGGASGDNVGSYQNDELKNHAHTFPISTSIGGSNAYYGGSIDGSGTSDSTGGSETRPKNANVNYIIKF